VQYGGQMQTLLKPAVNGRMALNGHSREVTLLATRPGNVVPPPNEEGLNNGHVNPKNWFEGTITQVVDGDSQWIIVVESRKGLSIPKATLRTKPKEGANVQIVYGGKVHLPPIKYIEIDGKKFKWRETA